MNERSFFHMRIYFDTSAINAIVNHDNSLAVVHAISSRFETLFSTLNIFEMIQTADPMRRFHLFTAAAYLANGGGVGRPKILVMEPTLLRRCVEHFLMTDGVLDFFNCETNDDWQQDIFAHPQNVLDEELITLIRGRLSKLEPRHAAGLLELRGSSLNEWKNLDRLSQEILAGGRARVFRYIATEKALLTDLVASQLKGRFMPKTVDKVRGRELELLTKSDSWRLSLAVFAYDIYNRVIRPEKFGRKQNPGWTDTKQAIYLAATDVFVTHDRNQRKMLRLVSTVSSRPVKIWSFERLISECGLS